MTLFHTACFAGQVKIIQYLIENEQEDLRYNNLDFRDSVNKLRYILIICIFLIIFLSFFISKKGNNGFMIACESGHFEVIEYLTENQVCPFRYLSAVNEVTILYINNILNQ